VHVTAQQVVPPLSGVYIVFGLLFIGLAALIGSVFFPGAGGFVGAAVAVAIIVALIVAVKRAERRHARARRA
jgi:uncharacterized membrane protein